MQDHQPPQADWADSLPIPPSVQAQIDGARALQATVPRLDGSVHADVPVPETSPGYVSVRSLRFSGQHPFRVTDHSANVGTVFIELSPEVSIAVRSEEQARALIVAAGQAAAIFAHAEPPRGPRHGSRS